MAVFAVVLLLFSACSIAITPTAGHGEDSKIILGDSEEDLSPELEFNNITYNSIGDIDTYLLTETIPTSDLYGDYRPEGCGETITIVVEFVLDEDARTIDISIEILDGSQSILSFEDSISEDGIADEENAWIYSDMVPRLQTFGIVQDVQNAWNLINELTDLLPRVSSDTLIKKIEQKLASAVVKKIATAAAAAVIPAIGWAIAIINVGLAAYDLYQLSKELPGLVEMAKVDIAGYKYDASSQTIKLAKRYCGEDSGIFALASMYELESNPKDSGKYYVSVVVDSVKTVFISSKTIERKYAVAIMGIPSYDQDLYGLSVYTSLKTDAHGIAKDAGGNVEPILHDFLHNGVDAGFYHYHHALHNGSRYYPAHALYGGLIYDT